MQPTNVTSVVRRLGGIAVLAIGAIHLQQLIVQDFRGIPTIRALFVLNTIGSCVVGLCLLASLERVLARRRADLAEAVLAALGLTIAVGSLVALVLAETVGLFGLMTRHYSTMAVLAIVAEGAAVLLLTPVLTSRARRYRIG
ncbi:MAG: hypothetical protein KGL16_02000 [Acidobacteriota bacterium]|nr:hypothetical protein [Acidobacteriota bacterium]